jgi:ribosomal protein L37AE/L43A
MKNKKVRFWWCTGHKGNGTFLVNRKGIWNCQSCGHKRDSDAWPKNGDAA